MLRRLGREDLAGVNPFLREKARHTPFVWHVYEAYEVVEAEGGLSYLQAVVPEGQEAPRQVRSYNPLVDTPRLFLDFARIAESKNPGEALSRWIGRYGLLGFAHDDPLWTPEGVPEVVVPPKKYDHRGGSGETLNAVWYEVHTTNQLLALYEAVLNRDADKLESLILTPVEDPESLEKRWRYADERMRETGAAWIDLLVDWALGQVWEHVMSLAVFAYPAISPTDGPGPLPLLTVDSLNASWGVRNLLGAMYLQFFWLVTSAGELSRCKYCGRIISYAAPVPMAQESRARKPRKDKEFCDSRCRQNYHYHNRIKPVHKG